MMFSRWGWAAALALLAACSSNTVVVTPGGGGADGGSVVTDGGGTEGADGGAVADLCNGVTTLGRCVDANTFEECIVPTERGDPRVSRQTCASGETCQVGADGKAGCVLTGACRNGDTECVENNTKVRTCTNNNWVVAECASGCLSSGVGAACATAGVALTEVTARVVYQRRTINEARNALGDITESPARGFLVTVQRGGTQLAASKTNDTDGSLTIKIPTTVTNEDTVKVIALADDGNNGIAYLVANPNLPAGKRGEEEVLRANTSVWSFEFPASSLQGANPVLRITEAGHASGVATTFDRFGVTYRDMMARYGGLRGAPIVIWMGAGVMWNCGACVSSQETTLFGTRFTQMMWYPADNDRSYYSDPVIGHEAGHWVMSAYGRSPGEGGGHSVTCRSFPGLAWSDGFATWLGNYAAGTPIYFDIQEGGLFWYDLATRSYNGSPTAWPPRPTPSDADVMPSTSPGLLQKISEGEVMAILWALSNGTADPQPILSALATARMTRTVNVSGVQRFERGYVRHDWDFVQDGCRDNNVRRLDEAAPILPDLLDAMMCAGFPRDRMDAATVPATYYPYPSGSPLCRQ